MRVPSLRTAVVESQAESLLDFLVASLRRVGTGMVEGGGPVQGLPISTAAAPMLASELGAVVGNDCPWVAEAGEYFFFEKVAYQRGIGVGRGKCFNPLREDVSYDEDEAISSRAFLIRSHDVAGDGVPRSPWLTGSLRGCRMAGPSLISGAQEAAPDVVLDILFNSGPVVKLSDSTEGLVHPWMAG